MVCCPWNLQQLKFSSSALSKAWIKLQKVLRIFPGNFFELSGTPELMKLITMLQLSTAMSFYAAWDRIPKARIHKAGACRSKTEASAEKTAWFARRQASFSSESCSVAPLPSHDPLIALLSVQISEPGKTRHKSLSRVHDPNVGGKHLEIQAQFRQSRCTVPTVPSALSWCSLCRSSRSDSPDCQNDCRQTAKVMTSSGSPLKDVETPTWHVYEKSRLLKSHE